jgi:hypothetical protein
MCMLPSHVLVYLVHLDVHPFIPIFLIFVWVVEDVIKVRFVVVNCHHIIGCVSKADISCQSKCRTVISTSCYGVD